MPIRVSLNILSHGTIAGESIVALAIRPRMKCMRGVWHKSRNFSVHHIVLRPGTPETVAVSVPSFGDSFFILSPLLIPQELQQLVSVPSFGDSFFMERG